MQEVRQSVAYNFFLFLVLKILKIYIFAKNPSNPTIARTIAKATPILKMIVPPFPPDDAPNFILNPENS